MYRTLEEMRRARWAWGCVAILTLIHVIMGMLSDPLKLLAYEWLGLSRAGWMMGRFATPLTYALLHAGWGHFLCNALMLFFLGIRLEGWLGVGKMVVMGVGGCLGGALFHLWLGGKATDVLVGASGMVMAMLLVLCSLSPQSRMFPLPVSARNLGAGILWSSLLLMLMNPDAGVPWLSGGGVFLTRYGLGDWFRIGHACHFGGALFGWCYGLWLMRRPVTREELLAKRKE